MSKVLLDAAGRRRSPATMPGFHAGPPAAKQGPPLGDERRDERGWSPGMEAVGERREEAGAASPSGL
jgi:hypothetical protein